MRYPYAMVLRTVVLVSVLITLRETSVACKLQWSATAKQIMTRLLFLLIAANITTAPSSVSTPLYTLANFTCVGTGDLLTWTVQGDSVTDPSNQDRKISVTTNNISVDVWSSVLTIRALPVNDRISAGCNVDTKGQITQKKAILTIKG